MMNIKNLAVLVGNLGKDPKEELKKTQNGLSVLTVSIAVDDGLDKDGQRKTLWVPVEAWRNSAEYLANNCHKGDSIGVVGRLSISQYTDNEGNNKERWKIVAESISRLKESQNTPKVEKTPLPTIDDVSNYVAEVSIDDLPF